MKEVVHYKYTFLIRNDGTILNTRIILVTAS